MARYLPVAQVSAEQYTSFAILYQLLYMFYTFVRETEFATGAG
jgi:hypothetical protein